MERSRIVLIASAVLAVILAAGCSSGGGWAARVDGSTISERQLQDDLRAVRTNAKYWAAATQQQGASGPATSVPAAFTARWLTNEIYNRIVAGSRAGRAARVTAVRVQQAEAQLAQNTPGWSDFPASFRQRLARANALATLVEAAVTDSALEPTDAQLEAFFTRNASRICPSGEVVSHILVSSEAEARAIADELRAGGDFAAIAATRSTDTQSGAAGGSLGCLGAQQFVPEFQTAADSLAPGQTSAPVQTQYGWHVIRVEAATYAALRASVQQAYQQVVSTRFQRWVQRVVGRAEVAVNPRYGTWRRAGGSYQVFPPAAPNPSSRPAPSPTGATGGLGLTGATP